MIPYDGHGYGKSEYWTYAAKQIAIEENEVCDHWFDQNTYDKIEDNLEKEKYQNQTSKLQVVMKDVSDNFYIHIYCRPNDPNKFRNCEKLYPKTEGRILDKFKEFYK